MQRGPMRPWMTGCILYLVLLAVLFLLSGSLVLQIVLTACLLGGAWICAYIAGKKQVHLPTLLSSSAFCAALTVPIVLALIGVLSVMHDYRALQMQKETPVDVCGVVERVHYASDSGAAFVLDLETVGGKRNHGKIRVQSSGQDYYANVGTKVSCTVVLGIAEQNDAYAQNILYAFGDGIYAYAEAREGIELLGNAFTFRGLCERIGAACRQRFYQYLPAESAELCIGILLGDKSVLSAEIKRDFRRVGASHILAVSGMHISILIGGLLFALKKTGIGVRMRYALALVFIVFFMGITGFSPSVMRAGIMWMLVCVSRLVHARTDALTSLFSAAALLCLCSPQSVFDIGFLLSVSASCGLIVLLPPLKRWLGKFAFLRRPLGKPLRSVIELLAMTLAATAFTMPITLLVFGELSLIAPIANLLLHVPIAVLLYTSPVMLLLSYLPMVPPVTWILRFVSGVVSGDAALIADMVGWMSKSGQVLIGVRYVFVWVLLAVCLIGFGCLYRRKRNFLLIYPVYGAFLLGLLLSLQIYAWSVRDDVVMTYSVSGKNEAIAVVTNGKGMLIDASDGSLKHIRSAWGTLSEQNLTELEVCVLTHYHNRYIPTLAKLMQETVVKTLVLPTPLHDEETEISRSLRELAVGAGVAVQFYRRGEDDILFGEAGVSFLPYAMLDRSVQPLLGLQISANGEDIVYLGGAAFEADRNGAFSDARDAALGQCEFLLLGVHGPLYKATLPPLSSLIDPTVVCICAGDDAAAFLTEEDRRSEAFYSLAQQEKLRIVLDGQN